MPTLRCTIYSAHARPCGAYAPRETPAWHPLTVLRRRLGAPSAYLYTPVAHALDAPRASAYADSAPSLYLYTPHTQCMHGHALRTPCARRLRGVPELHTLMSRVLTVNVPSKWLLTLVRTPTKYSSEHFARSSLSHPHQHVTCVQVVRRRRRQRATQRTASRNRSVGSAILVWA